MTTPAPLLALEVQGEGHAMTCRAVTSSGSAVYFLPPALSPALLPEAGPTPAGLLILPDLAHPEAQAYHVPAHLLPEVRRALALRPAFPFAALEEAPTSEPAVSEVDSRFICQKWEPVPWYAPTAYGRDLFGRSVIPALPPLRRTVRSGKGGKA